MAEYLLHAYANLGKSTSTLPPSDEVTPEDIAQFIENFGDSRFLRNGPLSYKLLTREVADEQLRESYRLLDKTHEESDNRESHLSPDDPSTEETEIVDIVERGADDILSQGISAGVGLAAKAARSILPFGGPFSLPRAIVIGCLAQGLKTFDFNRKEYHHKTVSVVKNSRSTASKKKESPRQSSIADISQSIREHVKQVRIFLDACIQGRLPNDFIRKALVRAGQFGYLTIEPCGWTPKLGMVAGFPMPLEDFVEIKGILLPLFNKDNLTFEFTKKCVVCGRYYEAKGPKAIFCSAACRSRYRRKQQ
jgi:hypothetical protein